MFTFHWFKKILNNENFLNLKYIKNILNLNLSSTHRKNFDISFLSKQISGKITCSSHLECISFYMYPDITLLFIIEPAILIMGIITPLKLF